MKKEFSGILFIVLFVLWSLSICVPASAQTKEKSIASQDESISSHLREVLPKEGAVHVVTDGEWHFPIEPYPSRGMLQTGDSLVRPGDEWGEKLTLRRIDGDGAAFDYEAMGDSTGGGGLVKTKPVELKIYWKKEMVRHGQE